MPANIGEMFYTGQTPWHGEGIKLAQPATLEEGLKVGGLGWDVGEAELVTAENPPSAVLKRKAIVRLDRPPGDDRRVLGVAHRGFTPIQNRDAALLFDAIFGRGARVYHTGGYLGDGEVVWMLAKIDKTLQIDGNDVVEPYALMANSHDGSIAFNIRLTTVRVVCQNTLALAMSQRIGKSFKRSHQGSFAEHARAAQDFFAATMRELDDVTGAFQALTKHVCPDATFKDILERLLPDPKKPRNANQHPGVLKHWEKRLAEMRLARETISRLRHDGQGASLRGARGTFWGA
jgi:phage/plasmid-like protein (TIGR03299 family)